MYAGDDSLHVGPVLARASEALDGQDCSAPAVGKALDDSVGLQLRSQIENQVLRKYGFTVDSFLSNGKKQLGNAVYNQICARIERTSLSLIFLACGFDSKARAHLLAIDGENAVQSFDEVGFAAIGAGDQAALSALGFQISRGRFAARFSSLEQAIYCACEAKFMAETASTVGKSTFVVIASPFEKPRFLFPDGVEKVRALWESAGAPRLPTDVEPVVRNLLAGADRVIQDEEEKRARESPKRDPKSLPPSPE